MKKTLLLLVAIAVGQTSFAQIILTEDFSTFTIGNLGTDITATTPGQNGWVTLATNGVAGSTTTNAANENFQIVDNATTGNALQITGPDGNAGVRLAYQNEFADAFQNREAGNDVVEAEFEFYTGSATASSNTIRVVIYNEGRTQMLSGINFNGETKVISGLAYYNNAGTLGNFIFGLGADADNPLILDEDIWVRVGVSYNYATGEFIWKGPGFWIGADGAAVGTEAVEIDVIVSSGNTTTITNLAANDFLIDNILVRALPESALLGVEEISAVANEFSVYPNPSNDVVNINVKGSIMNSAEIVDLNGRVVKSVKLNGVSDATINVADLASGVYMLNVSTENGKLTRKVVKN